MMCENVPADFFSRKDTHLVFYTQYIEQQIYLLCLIYEFMILFLSAVCENVSTFHSVR